ncbi:3'(2'),5'-bisphosphate nucleotidase CysQ [Rhizobium oryziradicis]|uniref:3'(2'),5'-bisphosphate nucleotidase CysQ n=1 Tax=Rhizobium oryziradicis TaxID=1867956 RepID=A0A1Q8ZUV9_9HYPH|nr:3'(2'),5'-bisphosphate nucleotidase CysQ [Rhizobium oryziradicis]OLP45698.1 3'(2'),5'-bisphosphate nucleotidase CysQ [Rhizobium oryziradicis]
MDSKQDSVQTLDWQEDLALITDAATQAGALAMTYFGADPEVWWKNKGQSPVSAADYAANTLLLEVLRTARPAYGWLSEETDDDESRLRCDTVFVIDPIDGTRAFLAGNATWCVSVAVVHKGRPVAGVLVAPALDEVFTATAAGAAMLNSQPITVATREPHQSLRVATPPELLKAFDEDVRHRLERVEHVPSLAYRLAMVAAGRIDATLVFKNSHDWDLAAADLILQRAGGALSDIDGKPLLYNRPTVRHGHLLAGSDAVLPSLLTAFAPGKNTAQQ